MVEQGWPWSFDGDGDLFRLVSEALRIHLAHLFDSALAVHTSLVEPLPHQITAVYQAMLPRQPLSGGLSRQPGRAVAGRAVPPLPPRLRDPHQRQAGSGAHRQLVPGDRPRHRPAGQAGARWRAAGEAPGARLPLGSGGLRRGAQDVGDLHRRRGALHEALPPGAVARRPDPSLSAADRHPAQRQGGGLPALHGAAGRRPL